ncbi:MmgE/PrpD family protein [Amycolatopsis sp. NPDC051903]|uniref:MmgE/PrpD family protein n=1 Tax=Amycolatopsis sp. NPDC051903 TaxID=3363936 RepID=UPI003797E9A2
MTSKAITERIAEFAVGADVASAPAELRERALRAVLDTVGVSLAGKGDAAVEALWRTVGHECGPGTSTILTTGGRTTATQAALLNGLAAHALDYDDVTHPIYGHASVALVPALLAVAEEQGASGTDLLDAYVVAYQVIVALGAGLAIREHYSRGWHSTATTGVVAATAGAARLCGLGTAATRRAIGIAASMASGSRQNFGTMTKPLHPGISGRDAVFATHLAANGFTADESQLESPLGYFAMYGEPGDPVAAAERLAGDWALLADGINVKKYPCCYNTHRLADATLELVPKLHGRTAEVTAITITVEPGGGDPLIRHRPVTGLEAKFSSEYVCAAALLDGRVSLESFRDGAVRRDEAQALLRKVELRESARVPFGPAEYDYAYAAVEIEVGGETHRKRVDIPRGDARLPLTDDELAAKFRDCVAYSGAGDAEALLAELRALPETERLGARALGSRP